VTSGSRGGAQAGYPLLLHLADRPVLVVGGGPVAARRVRGLLQAGALVRVVAPALCPDLHDLYQRGQVRWDARPFTPGDTGGAWLVHTATGEPPVDDAVAAEAAGNRVWCVRADDAAASDAWTPAVAQVDDVVVAVGGGGDPRRASAIRDAVQERLRAGALPMRRRRRRTGQVALVGGGPGDPDLITLRGRRLLQEADVVVVDRLAPRALLDELGRDVEIVEVGKSPGDHPMPQDEINRLLITHAVAGKRVVRLKGGDPFVFGRGGEELRACREAGVDTVVVPGVSSAFAVPAAAGIPVTHRGLARRVTVATAHDGDHGIDAIGGDADAVGTLVLLMGVARLGQTAKALMARGWPAATPVAVVESGWTPRQRTTVGTLETIGDLVVRRSVAAPAVTVVGAVAAFAEAPDG
jgi:uroporphyrin-III C-methyltransferase / precorrin-2 dehydrogenase / sirohydrochlorin ferrochelatase